jgi:hypothetical protein
MPAPSSDYWTPFSRPCAGWTVSGAIVGQADCAFQEGWADFWRLYVLNSPVVNFVGGGSLNYETPGSWSTGQEVPGRVAGALWDIFDSTADGTDALAANFQPIWDALKSWSTVGDGSLDRDLSQYWATWRAAGKDQCAATSIYQNTITYNADSWRSCAKAQVAFKMEPGASIVDPTGRARVPIAVEALKEPSAAAQVVLPPGGIKAFNNSVIYEPLGISVARLVSRDGFSEISQSIDNVSGVAQIRAETSAYAAPVVNTAFVYPRLVGSAGLQYNLSMTSTFQQAQPYDLLFYRYRG